MADIVSEMCTLATNFTFCHNDTSSRFKIQATTYVYYQRHFPNARTKKFLGKKSLSKRRDQLLLAAHNTLEHHSAVLCLYMKCATYKVLCALSYI